MIAWVDSLDAVTPGDAGRAWVWRIELDAGAAELRQSPERADDRADAALLKRPDAAGRRVLRRRLLRALVARATGQAAERVALARDAGGRLWTQGAHVSVAARGDSALLAVAPVAIGVDLEQVTGEPPPGFAEDGEPWSAWVAREAYAKAAGRDLDSVLALAVAPAAADQVRIGDAVAHLRRDGSWLSAAVLLG